MFSKALFKQSCKANGTMWGIITFAVCFMLACVMLISGNDSIGGTVKAVEDTIIRKEIEASMETRSIGYFNYVSVITLFDAVSIIDGTLSFLWKFAVLFVLGIAGYVAGTVKFVKKDLPL